MNIRFAAQPAAKTELLCYFFDGKKPFHSKGPAAHNGNLVAALQPGDAGNLQLSVQLGAIKQAHQADLAYIAGATCLNHARKFGLKKLCFMLDKASADDFTGILAGSLLTDYEFLRYKGSNGNTSPKPVALEVTIVAGSQAASFKTITTRQQKIIGAVNYARDLANTPGSDLVPEQLAEIAQGLAKQYGFKFTKLSAAQLKQQGYVGCLAVGQASEHPPVMFSLEYTPAKAKAGAKPLCFVGKGITFDTGGISLKPWDGMWDMKGDMGGAAAVLGIFKAIGELKPSMPITGVIASAENMPGGKAYLPGDILSYKNGRTVEVKSTDAEGRLVLADALIHAQAKLKQRRILEFSTLTGACARALGQQYIGLMSNFPELAAQVKAASDATGELVWELPLHPEYRALINSPIADIKNSGGGIAGAQTAGWFLHEFIEEGTQYVHLDIAGPFLAAKAEKYWSQPGATGAGVRLGVGMFS